MQLYIAIPQPHYMKYSLRLLLLVSIISTNAFAQKQTKTDSLFNVLKTSTVDTVKANVLNQLGTAYLKSNPDSSLFYAAKALTLSQQVKWGSGIANSNYVLSSAYKVLGALDSALIFQEKALTVYRQLNDSLNITRMLITTGLLYNTRSEYTEALGYYYKGLSLAEKINDSVSISKALLNIGLTFYHQKDYETALKYYSKGLLLQQSLKDKNSIASFQINMALIYNRLNKKQLALEYYTQSLKNFTETNNKPNMATVLGNLGTLYIETGNYVQGISYQWQAMKAFNEIKDKAGIGRTCNNLGESYRIIAADTIAKKLPDSLSNRKKLLQTSIELLLTSIEIKKQMKTLNDLQNSYYTISNTYLEMGDYKSAYENFRQSTVIKDSVFNMESKEKIANLEAKRETVLKEKEIQIQKLQLETAQKMKWVYVSGIVLILLLSLIFIYRYRLKQAVKFEKLRNNIASDLHDDMGSLLSGISLSTNIIQKKLNGNQPEVSNILSKMSHSSSQMMDSMSDIVWTINVKNDRFDNVINRMRAFAVQMLEPLDCIIHFNAGNNLENLKLDMEGRKNLYLLYKEAINNAAKYSDCKTIWINISLKAGKKLFLQIKDDGIGFDQLVTAGTPNHKMGGNGIRNMHKRASDLNGSLEIFSQKTNGTEVKLQFQL